MQRTASKALQAIGCGPCFTAKTGANKRPRKQPHRTVLRALLLSNRERNEQRISGRGRRAAETGRGRLLNPFRSCSIAASHPSCETGEAGR